MSVCGVAHQGARVLLGCVTGWSAPCQCLCTAYLELGVRIPLLSSPSQQTRYVDAHLMMDRRREWWVSIKPTLLQPIVFAGLCHQSYTP